MITDGQVRRLRRLLSSGMSLGLAALKSGMDRKSARRYRGMHNLPSDARGVHD
jgi:hypothetical protein